MGHVPRSAGDAEVRDTRRTEKDPEFTVESQVFCRADFLPIQIARAHNAEGIGQIRNGWIDQEVDLY